MPGGSSADILLPMWNDPATEWRRLTEHYKSLSDDELLELSADKADLTEVAQQVLRDEMKMRGLSESRATLSNAPPAKPAAATIESREDLVIYTPSAQGTDEDDNTDSSVEYTWKTLLCECETRVQARCLAEVLRQAHIDSWIEIQGTSYPKIMVAADQLDQARVIADQPISQAIIDEVRADESAPPELFELPRCPSCRAEDPSLESVDPANRWRCEACGREWIEAGTASPAEGR
jgi:hypothetical protein